MPNTPDKTHIRNKSLKAYAWEFTIYPDDPMCEFQQSALKDIATHWCYILHDADVSEDGELKKPHFHFYVFFDNQRHHSALCGYVYGDKTKRNLSRPIENKVMALRYLLHLDDKDKAQYGRAEVVFSSTYCHDMAVDAWDRVVETHEQSPLLAILEFIEARECLVRYSDVLHFVLECGAFGEYRRSYSIIRDILNEHNREYYDAETRELARLTRDSCVLEQRHKVWADLPFTELKEKGELEYDPFRKLD